MVAHRHQKHEAQIPTKKLLQLAQTVGIPIDSKTDALASPTSSASHRAGGASICDDSCVEPAALKAVLVSLKTGGLTAAERAKIKAGKKLAAKEEEERKAKEGMSAEVIRS